MEINAKPIVFNWIQATLVQTQLAIIKGKFSYYREFMENKSAYPIPK